MDAADLLSALAEIAIAIAGLAGIVLSFTAQRGGEEPEPGMRAWRVEILVTTSAAGFSFSVAPFFLAAFERSRPEDWIALSVVSSLAAAAYGVYGLRTQRKRFGAIIPYGHHPSDISFITITFGSAALVFANALGLIWIPHQAAYLCAIAPWFFTALLVFFRAVSDLARAQAEGRESSREEP
jgi:hypothetical protein